MWTYDIKTGKLAHNGVYVATGWAGHNIKDGIQGKNNPDAVNVKGIGPLPPGKYTVGQPYDSPHTGPYTLPLEPSLENEMYGRDEFKIHGFQVGTDPNDPYNPSSDGCIVQSRTTRNQIGNSPDKELEVI
jgi:hypothetical protein